MEGSRFVGVDSVREACGIDDGAADACFKGIEVFDVADGNWEASNPSGGDSTCCAVELKYRARLGRRKVGGSAEDDIRVSRMDLLIVLLSIVRSEMVVLAINSRSRGARGCSSISSFGQIWLTKFWGPIRARRAKIHALQKNISITIIETTLAASPLQHQTSTNITAHHASK